jgi:methylated-DNA-[protein]-cysteine S-methyltransferase
MHTYIQYINTPIGTIKIVADNEYLLEVEMNNSMPAENNNEANRITQQAAEQLAEYFEGKLHKFNLPVMQAGTAFQQRVWGQLSQIPYGKTISYKTLAIQLGDVKCIRAAGTANGKNKIGIIVPCHRVIGANGSLVGYAGGLHNKQWLLAHEAKYFSGVQTLFS